MRDFFRYVRSFLVPCVRFMVSAITYSFQQTLDIILSYNIITRRGTADEAVKYLRLLLSTRVFILRELLPLLNHIRELEILRYEYKL